MWLRARQESRVSPRVRQRNRGDRIRWHPDSYGQGCAFTTYVPKASDGYLLPQLGTPVEYGVLLTDYIKATVNGMWGGGLGALGNGTNRGEGIVYDPDGTGTFDNDKDWLDPGTPWDGWAFTGPTSGYFAVTIGGGNGSTPAWVGVYPQNPPTVTLYEVQPNLHYVAVAGAPTAPITGVAVIQYQTEPTQHGICINQLWLNTTGQDRQMYAMRGTDPDADNTSHGSAATFNIYGWEGIEEDDIVVAYAPLANQVMAIRTSNGGYPHKAQIRENWPTYDADLLAIGPKEPYPRPVTPDDYDWNDNPYGVECDYSDSAFLIGWDLGVVKAGEWAQVSCAYIFGRGADEDRTVAEFGDP